MMGRGSTGAEEGFFRGSERVRGLPTPGCGRGLVSSQERQLFFYTDYYIVYFYFICKHYSGCLVLRLTSFQTLRRRNIIFFIL